MESKRIIVRGRVQGVGFRYSTLNAANKFGIKGWVKNQVDHSVLIEAEGEDLNMNLFLDWVNKGPALSRVDEVLISQASIKNYNRFEIKR
jgi:acylphosphatase